MKNLKNLDLSTRIYNVLVKADLEDINTLSNMSFEDLKGIKGISDKSAIEIQEKLDVYKKSLIKTNTKTDKTYIFTKKKYIKSEGKKAFKDNKDFVNKFNGRIIDFNDINLKEKFSIDWCISK